MKNSRWILLFAAVIVLCAAAYLFLPRGGDEIGVWQDGKLVCTIDPAAVREDFELVLTYPAGRSIVRAGPDGVYIASADCDNQDCVRHGALKKNGTPIVCLPERIVIRYREDGDAVDAVIQ